MKAVRYNNFGGPNVLHIVDVDVPQPGAGEIRIAVRAAGVNPSDWKRREGQYREMEDLKFPAGVGVEASGIVSALGAGVTGTAIGDAVFGFGEDTMAEQAVLTHWTAKPADMPFEVAAGLPVITDTATRALDQVGIASGQTLLVSGAAGGIGTALLQIARERGIRVIGTASPPKQDYLRGLGAIPTTYGPGLAERVHALAPDGVDAAIDVAGSGIISDLIAIVGDPSHVLSVADFSAETYGAKFSHGPPKDPEGEFRGVADLWEKGRFVLHVERTFPLEQTVAAMALSAAKGVTGKLVVTVGDDTQ